MMNVQNKICLAEAVQSRQVIYNT